MIETQDELVALDPRQKISLKMTERIEVSPDSRIYRFALPSEKHKLGLPWWVTDVCNSSAAAMYVPDCPRSIPPVQPGVMWWVVQWGSELAQCTTSNTMSQCV